MREMREILTGDSSFARMKACCALGEIGPLARPAIPNLISALDSGDPVVMREAAHALGEVARDMPDAVPALTERLALSHSDVCVFSAEALGKIGEPALVAIPALEEAATSKSYLLSTAAGDALRKLRTIEAERKPNEGTR